MKKSFVHSRMTLISGVLAVMGVVAANTTWALTNECTLVHDGSERTLQSDGSNVSGPYFNTAGYSYVGGNIPTAGQYENWNTLIPFDLSGIDSGAIESATLSVYLDFIRVKPTPPFDVDVYGIGTSADTATRPGTQAELFYVGASDSRYDLLIESFLAGGLVQDTYVTGSSSALFDYLNAARPVGENIVWLRLNHDVRTAGTGDERTQIGEAINKRPFLVLETYVAPAGTILTVR